MISQELKSFLIGVWKPVESTINDDGALVGLYNFTEKEINFRIKNQMIRLHYSINDSIVTTQNPQQLHGTAMNFEVIKISENEMFIKNALGITKFVRC